MRMQYSLDMGGSVVKQLLLELSPVVGYLLAMRKDQELRVYLSGRVPTRCGGGPGTGAVAQW